MPQSLSHVLLHVVFSTKNRAPWLRDAEVRKGTHAYLAGACKALGCHAKLINGVEDHVHILCELSRTITIAGLLEEVKKESSKWVKAQGAPWSDFYWQRGYSVFSVSESIAGTVRGYIADQDRHHKRMSFQDELRKFVPPRWGCDLEDLDYLGRCPRLTSLRPSALGQNFGSGLPCASTTVNHS